MKLALILLLFGAPQEDGWSKLQVGEETVEVYRDSYGIPHIYAKTMRGAFWVQGYTEAQDRWTQMEKYRRSAKGETAELFGKKGVKADRDARKYGYTEAERKEMVSHLDEKVTAIVEAYRDGINAFLKDSKSTARAWAKTDSLAIAILMSRRFGEAGNVELEMQQIYSTFVRMHGEEKAMNILDDMIRHRDDWAPTTVHDHLQKVPSSEEGGSLPRFKKPLPYVWDGYDAHQKELAEVRAFRSDLGVPTYFGSNAWVVSPEKSASGRAMLYGGPMMGFRTPSICNEIHVVAPGLNAGGMSFPGLPGIMIGFNENIAWTTTSGVGDLVDVFVLTLNDEGQYLYKDEWHDFIKIDMSISVRGEETESYTVYRSLHGPLVGKPNLKKKRAYTLRFSFWKQEWRTIDALMNFNLARDLKEFEAAIPNIVTSHNFFVADKEGNIGFWYCGLHPKRQKGHDPRFPQPGDGSMDWEGILPVSEWPQEVNPERGFFANWNNKPAREWNPTGFGKVFWGKKMIEDLDGKEKLTFDEFEAIAYRTAYHDFLADYFKSYLLEAAEGVEDKEIKEVVRLLKEWDHMDREGDPRPEIMERWVETIARKIFSKDIPGIFLRSKDVYKVLVSPLLYIFEGKEPSVRLKSDFLQGRNLKELSLEALREVLKPGLEKLAWKAPMMNFGKKIGKIPSKKGRGTYQMTAELFPEGPRVRTLAAPGQSEKLSSPHYSDQVEMFRDWKYKPFLWSREKMK